MPFNPDADILPQEIFNLIVGCARGDNYSLLNLCLVSKSFLFESRRILYQKVVLKNVEVTRSRGGAWGVSTDNDAIFFTALANAPCLAHYVRELSYCPGSCSKTNRFWNVFRQAFYQMVNLKRLSLTLMTGDHGFFKELHGHSFQLEVFIMRDFRLTPGHEYLAHFPPFISSQHQLRTLDIVTRAPLLPVPPQSCQNLTTFIGDISLALPLLRSCPIINYVWRGGLLRTPTNSDELALSRLRLLIFHDFFPFVDFQRLANCLKSLEILEVSLSSEFRGKCEVMNATEFVLNLIKLKKLRVLVWVGFDMFVHHLGYGGTFHGCVPHFFESNTALKYVYYSEQRKLPGERYLRWERGNPLPIWVEVSNSPYFCNVLGDGGPLDRLWK